MFDLYGLYTVIPAYASLTGGTTLIDIGYYTTHIAYIVTGQLKLIRTINKGITHLAKATAAQLNSSNGDMLESIIRFGLANRDDERYTKAVRDNFDVFWQEIHFTLQSFINQLGPEYTIDHIILLARDLQLMKSNRLSHKKNILSLNDF